ncbi:insulin receptor substrate 2 [Bombina bombina]|uniref:insulin receptor substrate 2 n=1 Tax=Bombina bombina TaxID=8345 RepID=UPI00235A98A9|nr:insulin receptor substrate 2 [Bombina bombina]
MASPPTTGQPVLSGGSSLNHNNNNNNNNSSVKKCGYLRKQKHGHKRFFVLREPGEGCPAARLEYYESEKKWRSKSAAAKRVISLDSCLNINKRADAKNKYLIALYTRDEYFAVAAESEQEQESWYRALTDLLSTGRGERDGTGCTGTGGCCCPGTVSCSSSCSSHLALTEDPNYGLITPANAVYREVWQVNLKPRGLGQMKGMIGVHRLCLSARSISFVRLNSETPSVTLQLMNIRRCGHSDNYFFVEVGRSASTGPGEIWMQVDDSVVAQSIHETILEAMKAMRELVEFRPRSKSQSSSSNPISVPGRRHHLTQLPPSQTGLNRRTRTDLPPSSSSTSIAANITSRLRTASEGDNLSNRAISSSPLSPRTLHAPLSRSHTLSCGRNGKLVPAPGLLQHSRSMSMPVPRSPPSAASPISLSSGSSSGHGSASDPLVPPRPSSCSASVSGSPSDQGFMSLDEFGSSPVELARTYLSCRSITPDSVSSTPPQSGEFNGYMSMERPLPGGCSCLARRLEGSITEKYPRKRTYSLTTPGRQRVAHPQTSSASLDEATLIRATYKGSPSTLSSSPKVTYHPYPEDYADVEIGQNEDDGYMPMTPGASVGSSSDYVPMSPASVSEPQQILQPRTCCVESIEGSHEDSPDGYMRMWCGSKARPVPVHHRISPSEPQTAFTPPDYFFMQPRNSCCCQTHTVAPRKSSHAEVEPYVMMSSPASSSPHGRVTRPSRLALRTLPSMSEHSPESHSPPGGEYIHIYFGETRSQDSLTLPAQPTLPDSVIQSAASSPASSSSSSGPQPSPISDYMNLNFEPPSSKPKVPSSLNVHADYTEMSPRKMPSCPPPSSSPPTVVPTSIDNPGSSVQHLTMLIDQMSGVFNISSPPVDPNRGAKLIRADPQGGRRRHSSETFSSTTQVTPVSPSFAHSPKRHSSASVENVSSLRPGEALEAAECGSPMCRETSAGFQNGLNYIAIELSPENQGLLLLSQASSRGHLPAMGLTGLDIGSYPSIDFLGHRMKGATTVRE